MSEGLKQLLEATKQRIVKTVCSGAAYRGEGCWLWVPKHGCANKSICLVAHIDTVYESECPKRVFHDHDNGIYWSPDGLGADDRAGVYACVALRDLTGVMVLLTDGEESGGTGAREAAEIFKPHFKDTAFFLEIDRMGRKQAVFYNGETKAFRRFIKAHGFTEHGGTFSDISILGRKLGIPGVNVSAGYFHEHTKHEYLNMTFLCETMAAVRAIIAKGDERYDRERWKIADQEVCDQLCDDYISGGVLLPPYRRREVSKVAGGWQF